MRHFATEFATVGARQAVDVSYIDANNDADASLPGLGGRGGRGSTRDEDGGDGVNGVNDEQNW